MVVDKIKLKARYTTPANPYHLGPEFGLERVRGFLQQQGEWAAAVNGSQSRIDPSVHVIVEMRGKNEDDELELADLVASPYRLVGVETRTTKPCFRGGKIQAASKKWAGRGVGAEMFSVSPKTKGPDIRRSQLPTENPQSMAVTLPDVAP